MVTIEKEKDTETIIEALCDQNRHLTFNREWQSKEIDRLNIQVQKLKDKLDEVRDEANCNKSMAHDLKIARDSALFTVSCANQVIDGIAKIIDGCAEVETSGINEWIGYYRDVTTKDDPDEFEGC